MRFLPKFGCGKRPVEVLDTPETIGNEASKNSSGANEVACDCGDACESHLLRTIGWVTAALGAVALGMIVGRELRQRYKFNRRTPYDLYAHSGDELPDADYSIGI